MKKLFVIIAIIAAAAVCAISCNKQDPTVDPDIAKVQSGCVGNWKGTIGDKEITVTFSADGKITTTGNFSATITKWYKKNGSVCVDLDNDSAKSMMIAVNGVNMTITSNSADINAAIPSSLKKMLQ